MIGDSTWHAPATRHQSTFPLPAFGLAAFLWAALAACDSQSDMLVLRGRVLDELSQQPVKDASITITNRSDVAVAQTSSDASGRFQIEWDGSESLSDHTLRLERFGYDPQELPLSRFEKSEVNVLLTRFAPTAENLGLEFVRISAGTFQMGSTRDGTEQPVHTVTLSRDFYLGKHEVTQAQWRAVTGSDPSKNPQYGEDCPVEQVSWNDIQAFLARLNETIGEERYRLPTEAEWEYAARAGSTTDYHFGDDAGQLSRYGWYSANSGSRKHPVGQKEPNPWGLYDMYGNVSEYVHDWYGAYAADPATDPHGPDAGDEGYVYRGGDFFFGAENLRSARRDRCCRNDPGPRLSTTGFRLVKTIE